MNDIREILKRYKQRFISPRSVSRTYFLTRLGKNHSNDLVLFNDKFGNNEDLLKQNINFLPMHFKKKKVDVSLAKEILLNYSPTKEKELLNIFPEFYKKDITQINKYIRDIKELESNLEELKEKNITASTVELNEQTVTTEGERESGLLENISDETKSYEKRIKDIRKEFNSFVLDLIDKQIKLMNREFLSIEKLMKSSDALYKSFGKNDLYLGFPFIEGKFNSNKLFRAPLVLHRVEVKRNSNSVSINIVRGESIINPVFLVSYHLENNLEHQILNWNLETNDYINEAIQKIKNMGIKIEYDSNVILKFQSCTKKEYKELHVMDINTFVIKNNIVLGAFPISDKNIFNDLQTLENYEFKDEDSISTFVKGNENIEDIFVKKEDKRAKENEIKYITSLDFSQKNVVKEALSQNLVIEGPPGTGKSQVLSNIVANYVNNGKRVLVVSEKLAALEVIYNRIGKLSVNTLLIRNHITDKQDFYTQVKKAIQSITEDSGRDIYRTFTEIDNENEEFFDSITNRDKLYNRIFDGFTFEEVVKLGSFEHSTENLQEISEFPISKSKKQFYFDMQGLSKKAFANETFKYLSETYNIIKKYENLQLSKLSLYFRSIELMGKYTYDNRILFYLALNNMSRYIENKEILVESKGRKSFKELFENLNYLVKSKTLEKYMEYLNEKNKSAYTNLPMNNNTVELIEGWKDRKERSNLIMFKRLFSPEYNLPFFKKANPTKILTQFEMKIYKKLDANQGDLRPSKLLFNNLSDDIYVMLDYLVKNCEILENLEKVTIKMFLSNIYKIDLVDIEREYLSFCEVKEKFSEKQKKCIGSYSEIEKLVLVDAVLDEIKSEEEFIQCIGNVLVKEFYEDIKVELGFYGNYSTKYEKVMCNINSKVLKSRVNIENNVRRAISIKGQRNQRFARAVGELRRISELKRKRSIAQVTKKFTYELLELFPICLMTPGSVSATLENQKNLFDVVIFDEASQMYVEHAVPSIHRSKRIIVAGDSKQLRPSSFFTQRYAEDDIDDNMSFDITAALEEESLLDYCKNKYKSVNLRYHYRSNYKELINFSNRAFYDNKLVFSNSNIGHDKLPIKLLDVYGEWVDNKNEIEANQVVEIVQDILISRKSNETIGIITFNAQQKDLIQDMLDDLSIENEALYKELGRQNKETGSDESLFVKNIENVQGDERDIIIFSIGYAKNNKGRFINQFGPISQPTGENRLNVAITRAKDKVYIVKSINSKIMNVKESNKGAYFFKKYLQYVELLNNQGDMETFLNQLSDIDHETEELSAFDSPFEEEVYSELCKNINGKYEVRNQIKVGSFSIDLAIYSKEEDKFILGIECDGAMFHSSKDAVENDFYRQIYLESRGWNIYRIWSTNWWQNKTVEIKKLLSHLEIVN